MSGLSYSSTQWHDYWKSVVPATHREQRRGNHIADVIAADECVVEIQHASMSPTKIMGRELDHGHMVWIWDGRSAYDSGALSLTAFADGIVRFRWKNQRRNLRTCRRPCFLDLWAVGESGERMLLKVDVLNEDGTGSGQLVTHHSMRLWMVSGLPRSPLAELPEGSSIPLVVLTAAVA
ncbi:hypothetical protein ABZ729_07825 [Streptomyces sp. NPDC006678]|uniref:hypothetical protein n=1 Tax=Streptomyces sp. NPDC006678 TaxID=3157185 RepID=UPI0033DDC032